MVEIWSEEKEEQLARLLNSTNTETKNVLLAFCLEEKYRDTEELTQIFTELVKSPFKNTSKVLKDYIEHSFLTTGLAKSQPKDTPQKSSTEYALTEKGRDLGRKIAAFNINWTNLNDTSIYQILGSTHSSGDSRSPYNRFRILETIPQDGTLRNADLETILDLNRETVRLHIQKLQKTGLITCEYETSKSNWATYSWIQGKNPQDTKPVRRLTILTKRVAEELVRRKTEMNNRELAKILKYNNPAEISRILKGLQEQGFVAPQFNAKEPSKIQLTEKGKKFRSEYIQPARTFIETEKGPVLDSWKTINDNNEMKSQYSKKGVDIYAKVSPYLENKNNNYKKRIFDYLQSGDKTPKDISEHIGINKKLVYDYVSALIKAGKVSKRREGQETYYAINKQPIQP